MTLTYHPIDFQLLFELRLALEEGKLLPAPVLRILAARGWVFMPCADAQIEVHAEVDGDTLPRANYLLGEVRLTPVGRREIALFRQCIDYPDMLAILADEEPQDDALDDDGFEDEDGA